jgi:hypothetical protein
MSAEAALDIAVKGPTADAWTPPGDTQQIILIRTASDIPAAGAALARMLNRPTLRLNHTKASALIATLAIISTVTAEHLRAAGHVAPAAALTAHATHLTAAGRAASSGCGHRPAPGPGTPPTRPANC